MATRRLQQLCIACAALALVVPTLASAQSNPGSLRVGGLLSGSMAAGHAAPTIGISGSYRVAPRLSVEGDLSHFRDITLVEFAGTVPSASSWHARATSISANVLVDLSSGSSSLRPFLAFGGGSARVRREVRGVDSCACARTDVRPLATFGGGVDVLLSSRVALGLDVRFQRVFEDPGVFRPNLRSLKRVGTVVSYRF
jgi:hypothetical protein